MNTKLVKAHIDIAFSQIDRDNKESFDREFDTFGEHHQDPLSTWIKLAKAKNEVKDTNEILLQLVVELHRKVDKLERMINKEENTHLPMTWQAHVHAIGHTNLQIQSPEDHNQAPLPQGSFYGRLDLPVFPQRQIPVFFTHQQDDLYKIDLMHQQDILDYDSYIKAKERAIIRQMKGLN